MTPGRMKVFAVQFLVATAGVALLVAVVPTVGPNPASAASTSPGKKAAFESSDFGSGNVPVANVTLLSATIEKGKRKHVLVVEATLSSGANTIGSFNLFRLAVDVNGFPPEPRTSGFNDMLHGCVGDFPCMATGTWWLDLDAAEMAFPGTFIGQPLTVTLTGGEDVGAVEIDGKVTMSVRMQKK